MKILLASIFTITISLFFGQNQKIDSLENLLFEATLTDEKIDYIDQLTNLYGKEKEAELYVKSALDLTQKLVSVSRCKALNNAFDYYLSAQDYEQANVFKREEIEITQTLNDRLLEGECYYDLGKSFAASYDLDSATLNFQKAVKIFEALQNWNLMASTLNKMGIIEKDLGNYATALDHYHQVYELSKTHQFKLTLASTCINIGVVLKKQNELDDALKYYTEALEIYKIENDFLGLANAYNNIGNVLRIKGDLEPALYNYKLAIENRLNGGSEKTLSYSYNNIALVFKEKENYDSTLFYLKKSEAYKIKLSEESSLTSTYLNFADTYLLLNDSANFMKYFDLSEQYALEYNQLLTLEELYSSRSKFEYQKGNFKEAYHYLLKVVNQLDTLDANQQIILSKVLQAKFQDKQKSEEINQLENSYKELDAQKNLLQDSQRRFKWMTVCLIVAALGLVVVLIFLQRNYNALKKGSQELSNVNKELAQSRLTSGEKDTLIKEIHHRVKNNLQIIKSLIRLQNASIDDHLINEILVDFESRVSSMALVHESLYKSLDLSKVNVGEYYTKLLSDLIEAYSLDVEIERDFKIEIENFGIDTLIPLGLLTNEIISNALKHGFTGLHDGRIYVQLRKIDEEFYELRIGDNGIGMHEKFQSKQSLGMELIDTLVTQLDGQMQRKIDKGTHYIIKFRSQDKKE